MNRSLAITRLVAALAALSLAAAAPGCAAEEPTDEVEIEDQDHEEDPGDGVGQTGEELKSAVDCTKRTQTAYRKGDDFKITTIKVGGKAVTIATGHAFLKMQKAADAAGVSLSMRSGFRTMDEQKYFYNCYLTKKCNNGNLAAKPGYSNHQSGSAVDLSTSTWLANNAGRFGFKRTVPSEPWHYEFSGSDPGGVCDLVVRQAHYPVSAKRAVERSTALLVCPSARPARQRRAPPRCKPALGTRQLRVVNGGRLAEQDVRKPAEFPLMRAWHAPRNSPPHEPLPDRRSPRCRSLGAFPGRHPRRLRV